MGRQLQFLTRATCLVLKALELRGVRLHLLRFWTILASMAWDSENAYVGQFCAVWGWSAGSGALQRLSRVHGQSRVQLSAISGSNPKDRSNRMLPFIQVHQLSEKKRMALRSNCKKSHVAQAMVAVLSYNCNQTTDTQ